MDEAHQGAVPPACTRRTPCTTARWPKTFSRCCHVATGRPIAAAGSCRHFGLVVGYRPPDGGLDQDIEQLARDVRQSAPRVVPLQRFLRRGLALAAGVGAFACCSHWCRGRLA